MNNCILNIDMYFPSIQSQFNGVATKDPKKDRIKKTISQYFHKITLKVIKGHNRQIKFKYFCSVPIIVKTFFYC